MQFCEIGLINEMEVELLYTPSYSPDINPVEFCFSEIKGQLNGALLPLVHNNIKLAVLEATETISMQDRKGYYEAT